MNTPGKIPPFHDQPHGDEHSSNGNGRDGLPRSVTRPDSASSQVDRLSELVHELDNLLDGSLRCVSLAARTLDGSVGAIGLAEIESVRKQLETASKALERMAGMVHAAMQGRAIPIGSVLDGATPAVTLAEAIEHAADVMRHAATAHQTTIELHIEEAVGMNPSGPIYPAVLNALKNALESIEAAGGRGTVSVHCRAETGPRTKTKAPVQWACIEILDDGAGMPRGVTSSRLFDAGYTTKSEGRGIGLALSRSLLERMGGHAEISPRDDRSDHRRPGAVLTLRFPIIVSEREASRDNNKRKRA
ncbi:MAG: HAMP domain-containing histidine kinase [Phycisphaeraceae bacterium]|nr:HAMP domain-containing histidine kinase [Phycisphaeraceae bacterium]